MELILNCTNFLSITDLINNDISNKKFVTYNSYDHTHFFVTSHNLKKTIKSTILKNNLSKMIINL